MSRTAVAIPALQAGASIGDVVRRTRDVLPDVLVVDDGSSDATGDAARAAGAEVVRHDVNRGKGAALVTAFRTLFGRGFDAVVTVDADGQHLPEEIPVLLKAAAGGADLVLGTREHLFARWSPRAPRQPALLLGHLLGRRPAIGGRADGLPALHPPASRGHGVSGVALRRGERGRRARGAPRFRDRDCARAARLRRRADDEPLPSPRGQRAHRAQRGACPLRGGRAPSSGRSGCVVSTLPSPVRASLS